MRLDEVRYSSARDIVLDCFADFAPPRRTSVADWAEQHRWLSNSGGGYSGRWQHEMAPYLKEPMECLTGTEFLTVAVPGPAQCGKSNIAENWFLASVAEDPANLLWYLQTDKSLESYVKSRIEPLIETHEMVAGRQGTQPRDRTLHFKRFLGMHAEFLTAAAGNLVNKSAPRIIADEIDSCDVSLGDLMTWLNPRRTSFGRQSKILAISHPDRARGLDPVRDWTAGVMAIYADSDRRTWWWPCPHCDGWSSPNPGTSRFMALQCTETGTLDEAEASAHLLCPISGCILREQDRLEMIRLGRWVGAGEDMAADGTISGTRIRRDTAGFWIVGVMSPFLIGGMGLLARNLAKAKREAEVSGDDQGLRTVTVKQLGYPYGVAKRPGGVDAEALASRAEPAMERGMVPPEARVVSVVADVQPNRYEVLWRAHGPGGESWVIDYLRIPAEPATQPETWVELFERMLRPVPIMGMPGRALRPRMAAYDSGGEAGVTLRAYEAWMAARKQGIAQRLGVREGRDVWSLLPSKGGFGLGMPRVQVVYPDSKRSDRQAKARGQIPLLLFNANLLKDDTALALALTEGPVVHLPAWLAEQHSDAWEQLTSEKRDRSGRWGKERAHARNELWDLLVLGTACSRLHGLHRINWEKPPSWAAAWDANPLVVAEGDTETVPAVPRAAPAPNPVRPSSPRAGGYLGRPADRPGGGYFRR